MSSLANEMHHEQLGLSRPDWKAIAIENARLYERADTRRLELERAIKGLEHAVSLAGELGVELDLARVLKRIVERGRALLDARLFVALVRQDGRLVVADAAGDALIEIKGRSLPAFASSAGLDVRSDTVRLTGRAARSAFAGVGIHATSVLLSPVRLRGRSEGVLAAFDPPGESHDFNADDELVLSSLATTTAIAMAATRAVDTQKLQLSIEASEQERRRWARELHDETLQELAALKVMQESARQRGGAEAMRSALEQGGDQLERMIAGLEGLITDLRPAALDQLGVEPALEALVDRVKAAHDLRVQLTVDLAYERGQEPTRLTPELEATIYRVVQEGFNNVVKHAEASRTRTSVIERDEDVTILVEDDGEGYDPQEHHQGFGIVGMRERVELVGGELSITSRPGGGTRIMARLPVARAEPGSSP